MRNIVLIFSCMFVYTSSFAYDTTYLPWKSTIDMQRQIRSEMEKYNKQKQGGTTSSVGTPIQTSTGSGSTSASTSGSSTSNLNIELKK